ncbi:MAG: exodeoxyribonuclease VII large subunit [Methanoregula sp.]|jgi:exodeoxyribonuclease VII large subunit|uniref:exodeoxyribonuclease VII large subunit n=1 Tax=Methanoregula sp. TaxID=2052170 RepID=UPI0025CFB681|nr:exodeoxyribonuclease VII large subunit [Methanoregula sp.]MCK9630089.1 exodeoxyribonuclease VII large subunit [Methanoregula sp.]
MDWFNTPDEPPAVTNAPLLVSELSAIIAGLLDDPRLQDIRVRGEVTNYKHHGRGHRYFSLSEKGGGSTAAVIKCVMWRSDADRLVFTPAEGMEVVVSGSVVVYAPHGAYQMQVRAIEKAGLGEKYLLVEQWKKELSALGLFAAERKRPLPVFPARVGVVTSETGAVIHDIRNVIGRRFPVEIIISPTAVQGEEAHTEIAGAIRRLTGLVDVVIVARGGGSFEDLFPFNHPDVVKAIAACPVPVVSAIGHEVDVTLADLAADVRAPTPSAAAELVVPDRNILLLQLQELKVQTGSSLLGRIVRAKEDVTGLRDRLRPQRFLRILDERKTDVADIADRLERGLFTRLERERLLLDGMRTALAGRSPRALLARGYCVAERDGMVIRGVGAIAPGDRMKIQFYDGSSLVNVERVDHDGNI